MDVPDSGFPPDLIAAWLDGLPEPVESGLTGSIALDGAPLFGKHLDWMGGAPRGTLRSALSAFLEAHPGVTAVAMVCAMIDVQLYKRDSQKYLDRRNASLVGDLPWMGGQEEQARLRRVLEAHPVRSRQWIRAVKNWRQLRAGPLAPDAIAEVYFSEHPPLRDLLPPPESEPDDH